MNMTGRFVQNLVLPFFASVLVGVGSAATTGMVMTARLEERVSNLESQLQRHEQALDRDFGRHEQAVSDLGRRTDDQERRLAKLEGVAEATRASLTEIRADIKTLLRGTK